MRKPPTFRLPSDPAAHPDDVREARHRFAVGSFTRLAGYGAIWPMGIGPLVIFAWDDAASRHLLVWLVAATSALWS